MKLFVWNAPISLKYGSTCLYVVADNEEQAREIANKAVISKFGYRLGELPPAEGPGFDKPLGPPDRVIEAPCAEIYWWKE